jgi:hypothetical protein
LISKTSLETLILWDLSRMDYDSSLQNVTIPSLKYLEINLSSITEVATILRAPNLDRLEFDYDAGLNNLT